MASPRPPTAPSTVFPGLIEGISFFFPNSRPNAYAPTSVDHVSRMGRKTSEVPAAAPTA